MFLHSNWCCTFPSLVKSPTQQHTNDNNKKCSTNSTTSENKFLSELLPHGTVCQQNCVSQTSDWGNFDGYWKRFCLRETPALSDFCFRVPYKYSATTTTTTTNTVMEISMFRTWSWRLSAIASCTIVSSSASGMLSRACRLPAPPASRASSALAAGCPASGPALFSSATPASAGRGSTGS